MTETTLAIIDERAIETLSTPAYQGMLAEIAESAIEINKTTQIFQKNQSQFMDNLMVVHHPTPFRNLRQVLAEMKNARQAMAEAYFAVEKKKVEIDIRKEQLKTLPNNKPANLQRRILEIEITELEWSIEAITENVGGAIRKLANFTNQYKRLKEQLPDMSESAFESEEERYHIMKVFEQALNAALSHGGVIDEGNLIYLTQIGVNGIVGQEEVTKHIAAEKGILDRGEDLNITYQLNWLSQMADKYRGCSKLVAAWKGTDIVTDLALVGSE